MQKALSCGISKRKNLLQRWFMSKNHSLGEYCCFVALAIFDALGELGT